MEDAVHGTVPPDSRSVIEAFVRIYCRGEDTGCVPPQKAGDDAIRTKKETRKATFPRRSVAAADPDMIASRRRLHC